jgi:hypothetical protein
MPQHRRVSNPRVGAAPSCVYCAACDLASPAISVRAGGGAHWPSIDVCAARRSGSDAAVSAPARLHRTIITRRTRNAEYAAPQHVSASHRCDPLHLHPITMLCSCGYVQALPERLNIASPRRAPRFGLPAPRDVAKGRPDLPARNVHQSRAIRSAPPACGLLQRVVAQGRARPHCAHALTG